MIDPKTRVALVGATGLVGREMLDGLADLCVAPGQLSLFASPRSEGEVADYRGEELEVEKVSARSFAGVGLVLLAVPADAARELAPVAQAAGAWVVDVSPAFRRAGGVPLVLPAVNAARLDAPFTGRIVACPGAATAALVTALEPWRARFGLDEVSLTALWGASGRGKRGVAELEQQTASLLSGREPEPGHFPHRLAFNLVPQVGELEGEWTEEENSWRAEAGRLWGATAAPELSGTAVQVPTFFGCCLAVSAKLSRPATQEALQEALRTAPGVKLLDSPAEKIYPMPMLCTADPNVHVGRVRLSPGKADRASMFIAVDNAGRGASLNALDIAGRLARPGG